MRDSVRTQFNECDQQQRGCQLDTDGNGRQFHGTLLGKRYDELPLEKVSGAGGVTSMSLYRSLREHDLSVAGALDL